MSPFSSLSNRNPRFSNMFSTNNLVGEVGSQGLVVIGLFHQMTFKEYFRAPFPSSPEGGHIAKALFQICGEGIVGRLKDYAGHAPKDLVSAVENPIIPNAVDIVSDQFGSSENRTPSAQFTNDPVIGDADCQLVIIGVFEPLLCRRGDAAPAF